MRKVRITVIRKANYADLSEKYELPQEMPCSMHEGRIFMVEDCRMPDGFCESAWQNLLPFVMTLAHGGHSIYGNWMKNPRSAMISCNDGFRPVSFLLEALDGE